MQARWSSRLLLAGLYIYQSRIIIRKEGSHSLPRPFGSMWGDQDPAAPERVVPAMRYIVEYSVRHAQSHYAHLQWWLREGGYT